MKIKEVKDAKNKEALKEKIKNWKCHLMIGRFLVCLGAPLWVAILGNSIQETNENQFLMSIFALGVLMTLHYQNHDRSHELYKLEDQLYEMEEQENTEEYTKTLTK